MCLALPGPDHYRPIRATTDAVSCMGPLLHVKEYMVPEWVKETWEYKVTLRGEWKAIVKAVEAEKWVAGVGEAGGEEGVKQWVDLMRRIARRSQGQGPAVAEVSKDARL